MTAEPPSLPLLPTFPADFVWGAATAAYQIEGGVHEGGRGDSIWDTFCRQPGRIADGGSGDIACDHFHRYAEDTDLMRGLGLGSYRYSFAWPRIQPTGRGPANRDGLAFYDRLIDGLLEADIAPLATLYHWDLPQALQDEGGWLTRDTAQRFAEYAALVADHFSDRVAGWIPVNEPSVVTVLGHALGMHAPGQALLFDALPVAHHLLLAHGLAVTALRSEGAKAVGCANNHTPVWVHGDSDADQAAATTYDTIWNWLIADPMLRGSYPDRLEEFMPGPVESDLAVIAAPLDFYGVNYYNPTLVGAPIDGEPAIGPDGVELPAGLAFSMFPIEGVDQTDFGWPVVPDGIRELLHLLCDRFGDALPPIQITESGCSYGDGPDANGAVADQRRVDYHDGHLRAIHTAIAEGADVRGYFCWSLIDNFEWAEGFRQRFGLVHIDYATQRRTAKASYHWYADVIRAQREAARQGKA